MEVSLSLLQVLNFCMRHTFVLTQFDCFFHHRNGGGAFLIPYIISLIFMGLPVFLFEMGAGQFSNEGPIAVWKMCPLFQGDL